MVLERTVCQSWIMVVHLYIFPSLKQKHWQWLNSPNQSQLRLFPVSAGTRHYSKISREAQEQQYANGGQDAPIKWEVLSSPTVNSEHLSHNTSLPEDSQSAFKLKIKFRALWARIPGHPGQTAWSFSAHGRSTGHFLCLFHGISTSVLSFSVFFITRYNLSIKPVKSHVSSFIVALKILHTTWQGTLYWKQVYR